VAQVAAGESERRGFGDGKNDRWGMQPRQARRGRATRACEAGLRALLCIGPSRGTTRLAPSASGPGGALVAWEVAEWAAGAHWLLGWEGGRDAARRASQGKRGGWLGCARSGEGSQVGQPGRDGRDGPFSFSLLFYLSPLLFYSLYQFKSNSIINACSTGSFLKQKYNMLRHDGIIKPPLVFYFTRLKHTHI
jgi:hypothetical protein